MRPERGVRYLLLCAALLLAACAQLPQQTPEVSAETGWQLEGKLGLWAGEQTESANLSWLQCPQHYRIRLSGALGSSAAVISGNAERVTLERSGEAPVSAADPEALAERLGWPLPVSALRHWLQARPLPSVVFSGETDEQGRLRQLQQQGWSIRYDRYAGAGELPTVMEMRRDGLRLKLIVRTWQAAPEGCART